MRRGSLVQLAALAALVAGAVTAVALLIPWLPPSASKERDRIDFVFWFTTGICIFVFTIVATFSIYALVKFRAPPGDDRRSGVAQRGDGRRRPGGRDRPRR